MLLTINNEEHHLYRVFDKNNNMIGLLHEFDTETCIGKQVRFENGKFVLDENGELIVDTITIEGGYALDPQGNKV